jgi:hypothetical protein
MSETEGAPDFIPLEDDLQDPTGLSSLFARYGQTAKAGVSSGVPVKLPGPVPMGTPAYSPTPEKPTQDFSWGGDIVDAAALGHWNSNKQSALNELASLMQETARDDAGEIPDTFENISRNMGGVSGQFGNITKIDRLTRNARRATRLLAIKQELALAEEGIKANTRALPEGTDPNMINKIFQGAEPMAYAMAPQLALSAVDLATWGGSTPVTVPMRLGAAGASGLIMGKHAYDATAAQALLQYGAEKGVDITTPEGMRIAMNDPDFVAYRDRIALKTGAISAAAGTALGVAPGGAQALTKAATGKALAQTALNPTMQGLAASTAGQAAGLGTAVTIGTGQQVATNYATGRPLGEGVAEAAAMFGVQDLLLRTVHAAGGKGYDYYRAKMAGTTVGAPGAGAGPQPGPRQTGGTSSGPSSLNEWQLQALIRFGGMPEGLLPHEQMQWIKADTKRVGKAFAAAAAADQAAAQAKPAQPAPVAEPAPAAEAAPVVPVAEATAATGAPSSVADVIVPPSEPAVRPGNVPPRPTYGDQFQGRGDQGIEEYKAAVKAWDDMYGQTHRGNGFPKSQAPAAPTTAPATKGTPITLADVAPIVAPEATAGTPDFIPIDEGTALSARDEAPAGGNNVVPREALKPTRPGFELVEVDPKLINDEHARSSPDQSVRTPGNEISRDGVTRTERAKRYIQAGDYRGAEPAELVFSDNGKLSFNNGRHRLKASEELGARSTFVSVPKDQAKRFSDQFGPQGTVESARDEQGDYRGSHRAPDGTNGEGSLDAMDRTYPDDIYGPKGAEYYGARRPDDVRIHRLIQSVRGNPDAMVTVYRAVPKGAASEITPGNWVSPSREYAAEHGDRFPGGFDIIQRQVRAGELFTEGNSLQEFGWNPTNEPILSARDDVPSGDTQGFSEQELRQARKNVQPSSVTNYDVTIDATNKKGKREQSVIAVQADSVADAKRRAVASAEKNGLTVHKVADVNQVSKFPMVNLKGEKPSVGTKVTQTPSTPEGWDRLHGSVDRSIGFANTLPDLGLSENWGQVLSLALPGGTGDLPPAPLRLHEWASNPAKFKEFFDSAMKENPDLISSAVEGLGSLAPVHQMAMQGKIPTRMVAMHFLWGVLSKQLTPFEQEAGWIKLTNNPKVLAAIEDSIAGRFSMDLDTWVGLVQESIKGPGLKAGNQSTSNSNAFHLTLRKWNGRWDELAGIINNKDLSGPQMRRAIYRSGMGAGSGFGYKVMSFNLLTLARRDMFIGDRWQFVNLWFPHLELTAGPDGVFSYNKGGVPEDRTRAYKSLNTLDKEASAEAVYALIENGMQKIADANRSWLEPILGHRPMASDIHWLSWNIIKKEPVGHSSLDSSTRALQEGIYERPDFPEAFPDVPKSTERYVGDGRYEVFGGNRKALGYSERRSGEGDAGLRPADPANDAGRGEAGPEGLADGRDGSEGVAQSARDVAPEPDSARDEVDRKAAELDRRIEARRQAQERNTNPETARRGNEQIAQRLVNELRNGGKLTHQEISAALRIVEKLMEHGYLDNLKVSVSVANPGEAVRGGYKAASELVQIFVRNTNQPGVFRYTFTHEVSHHLERMIPAKDLEAARQQFKRERAKWLQGKLGYRELLGEGNWLDKSWSHQEIVDFLATHDVDMSEFSNYFMRDMGTGRWRIKRTDETYRLTNFSEYFADKVADIATARDDARTNPQDPIGVWARMKAFFAQLKKSLMDVFGKDKVEKIWENFQRGKYTADFKRDNLHGYDRARSTEPVVDDVRTADYRGRRMGPADQDRQTRVDNIDKLEPNKPIPRTRSARDDGENTPIPGGYREAFFQAKKGAGAPEPKQIKWWTDVGHDVDADTSRQFLWAVDRQGQLHVTSVKGLVDKGIGINENDLSDSGWERMPTHLDWAESPDGVQGLLSGPAHGRIDATGDVVRISLIQKSQSSPEIKAETREYLKGKLAEYMGESQDNMAGYDFTDAGPFTDPEVFSARDEEPAQAPMSVDQRKARIEEIKREILPLAQKGSLSREEGARYSKLGMELETHRFEMRAGRGLKLELIKPMQERGSAIPSEIVKIASDELAANRAAFEALTEASLGVRMNKDTAVDVIMNGENSNVSPTDLYSAFDRTRDALRRQFGDTIELYRAQGKQKQKATQNWHSTEAGAREYGNDIERRSIPVDDIVAVNVGLRGAYEEFVVGKKPSSDAQDTALSARDEEPAGNQFVPVEQLFNEEPATAESLYSPTAKKNLPAGSTMEFGPLKESYGADRSYGSWKDGVKQNDHSAHKITVRDSEGNVIAEANVIADWSHVFTKRPKYLDGKIQRKQPKLEQGWAMTVEMITGDNPRAQVAVAAEAVERAKMAGATMVIVPFKGWDHREAVGQLISNLEGTEEVKIDDEIDALNVVFKQNTPDYASEEDGDAAYGIRRDQVYSARDDGENTPIPGGKREQFLKKKPAYKPPYYTEIGHDPAKAKDSYLFMMTYDGMVVKRVSDLMQDVKDNLTLGSRGAYEMEGKQYGFDINYLTHNDWEDMDSRFGDGSVKYEAPTAIAFGRIEVKDGKPYIALGSRGDESDSIVQDEGRKGLRAMIKSAAQEAVGRGEITNVTQGITGLDYSFVDGGDSGQPAVFSARDEESSTQPALPEVRDSNIPKGGLIAAVAAMTPTAAEAATRAGSAVAAASTMDIVTAAAAIGLAGNDRLLSGLNPIAANMHLLARDTKSPTILSVAEMFNRLGGNVAEGAQETYFEERDGNRRVFRNKLVEAFKPLAHLSEADLKALDQDIAMALAGEKTLTGAEGQVVANLQAFSDELFDYLREAGVKVNYAKDYGMPHSFNSEKVLTDDQAFLADATRAYRLNNPMRIKRLTDYIAQIDQAAANRGRYTAEETERKDALNKEINELQNAKPAEQAQALLEAIDTSNAGGDATQGLLLEAQGTGQNKADFTRERIFEPAARRILRDYFNNDPRHAWNSYIARATTLAEFARRFGGDGSKWTGMVRQMRAEKVSNKDITRIKNMVLDSLGVLNVAPTEGHALAVSILGLSNMAKLKSTALTNFLEAQAQAIPGDLRQTVTSPVVMLGQFMAIVAELPPRQQAQLKNLIGLELSSETGSMELARAVGLIDAAGVHEMMENSAWNIESAADFAGATKVDKAARVLSSATGALARTYGIEATENAKRAMAARYAAGRLDAHVSEFLRDGLFARAWDKMNQNNPNAGTNPFTLRNEARMRLRRAGVSDAQMQAFAQWWETARASDFNAAIKGNDPMAKLARKVIRMESARASVNTNRAMKPGGKENPLVSQDTFAGKAAMTFLNYPSTFLQQIGKPMIRDVKTAARGYESEGGQSTHYSGYERTRMAARALAIPAMAVSAAVFLALRAWAQGHEDDVKAKPLWKHLLEGFTYTGLAGGKSEFASRVSRGQLPPILDEGNRLVRDMNRNDDKKNSKERAVTQGAIRGVGVPAALGLSSRLLPVPLAVVVNQALASQTFREMATDFIAGKAAPKKQGSPGGREGGSSQGREGERRPGR